MPSSSGNRTNVHNCPDFVENVFELWKTHPGLAERPNGPHFNGRVPPPERSHNAPCTWSTLAAGGTWLLHLALVHSKSDAPARFAECLARNAEPQALASGEVLKERIELSAIRC